MGAPLRKAHWERIGIEVREVVNRRWLGRDSHGQPEYKVFQSSWQVLIPAKLTGKNRLRKQFSDQKSAVSYAEGKGDLHRHNGPGAFKLSDLDREDAAAAKPILQELNLSFLQAAQLARKHLRPHAGDVSITQLTDRILKEKERKNLRPDSLRTLRWNFKQLGEKFGQEQLVKSITRDDLRMWVEQLEAAGHKGRNLRNYIRYAKQFFAYALAHQFRADDPSALIELPVIEWKPPCILSIEETKRLLKAALVAKQLDLLPAITLQLFVGGLRTEEVNRLTWGDINLENRTVDISPAVGKNRRDGDWRTADIPDNAIEFLLLRKDRTGRVAPDKYKDRMSRLHKLAGFQNYNLTHKNSKRHSFGSYGCKLRGPSWVQEQMGHNTKPTFLKCYRNAKVTEANAQEYFKLTPSNVGSIGQKLPFTSSTKKTA